MNNDAPQDFISKLPPVPLVKPDITDGVAPLPPTSLLSEAERKRLEELASTGQTPIEPDKGEELSVFEDGATVKWLPRPGSDTQCLLVDASGKHLAIIKDSNIADFISNAVNTFVLATALNNENDNPIQILAKPLIFPGK